MQTSTIFHPLPPPGAPFAATIRHPKSPFLHRHNRLTTMAFKKDGSSGKMVDENMITLRVRIREMKAEIDDDHRLPDDWMQWEKTYIYSGGYHSDVYQVVAVLQRFLMDCRPSVALGLAAVLAVGGSTATVAVLQWLLGWIQGN